MHVSPQSQDPSPRHEMCFARGGTQTHYSWQTRCHHRSPTPTFVHRSLDTVQVKELRAGWKRCLILSPVAFRDDAVNGFFHACIDEWCCHCSILACGIGLIAIYFFGPISLIYLLVSFTLIYKSISPKCKWHWRKKAKINSDFGLLYHLEMPTCHHFLKLLS